jgi:hypothetical protein
MHIMARAQCGAGKVAHCGPRQGPPLQVFFGFARQGYVMSVGGP